MQIKHTLRRIVISRRPIVGVVDVDVLLIKTTHVLVPRPPFNHHNPLVRGPSHLQELQLASAATN